MRSASWLQRRDRDGNARSARAPRRCAQSALLWGVAIGMPRRGRLVAAHKRPPPSHTPSCTAGHGIVSPLRAAAPRLLLRGVAADVQEVGGRAAVQLDDVHGSHGQAGAVDHAADAALQADVVQVELAGGDLPARAPRPARRGRRPRTCWLPRAGRLCAAPLAARAALCHESAATNAHARGRMQPLERWLPHTQGA